MVDDAFSPFYLDMSMFNIVENVKNRNVLLNVCLDEIVDFITNPDTFRKAKINKVREIGKGNDGYSSIKESLPSVGFNFTYSDYIKGANVEGSTGFIYIDVDDRPVSTDFSDYPFVAASWKSLSNNGIGILVSVEGITPENYTEAYFHIAEVIGVTPDPRAKSIDRLTVLSYDKNMYINKGYSTYNFKKVYSNNINTKFSNRLVPECTFTEISDLLYKGDLRTSDIEDFINNFDFNGEPYIDLKEDKIHYSEVYIPTNIGKGSRNVIMYNICSQIYGLNPNAPHNFIKAYCYTINNRHISEPLDNSEVESIAKKVLKKEPTLNKNRTKRILFNPDYDFTIKEKQRMSAIITNKATGKRTIEDLVYAVENWNFEKEGKITQKKVMVVIGKKISTVKNYWHVVKEMVKDMNIQYKNNC